MGEDRTYTFTAATHATAPSKLGRTGMDVSVRFPDEDAPAHQGANPRKVTTQPCRCPVAGIGNPAPGIPSVFPAPSFQLFLQLPYPGLGPLPSRPRSLPHARPRPDRSGLLAQPASAWLPRRPSASQGSQSGVTCRDALCHYRPNASAYRYAVPRRLPLTTYINCPQATRSTSTNQNRQSDNS